MIGSLGGLSESRLRTNEVIIFEPLNLIDGFRTGSHLTKNSFDSSELHKKNCGPSKQRVHRRRGGEGRVLNTFYHKSLPLNFHSFF